MEGERGAGVACDGGGVTFMSCNLSLRYKLAEIFIFIKPCLMLLAFFWNAVFNGTGIYFCLVADIFYPGKHCVAVVAIQAMNALNECEFWEKKAV